MDKYTNKMTAHSITAVVYSHLIKGNKLQDTAFHFNKLLRSNWLKTKELANDENM